MKYSQLTEHGQDMVLCNHLNIKSSLYFNIVCCLFAEDNDFNNSKIIEKIDDFDVDKYADKIGTERIKNAIHRVLLSLDSEI